MVSLRCVSLGELRRLRALPERTPLQPEHVAGVAQSVENCVGVVLVADVPVPVFEVPLTADHHGATHRALLNQRKEVVACLFVHGGHGEVVDDEKSFGIEPVAELDRLSVLPGLA